MVSLFLYPVFKERHLRCVGQSLFSGERLLLSLGNLVKSFFDLIFSATLAGERFGRESLQSPPPRWRWP